MNFVFAKIKTRTKTENVKKLLSSDDELYGIQGTLSSEAVVYDPRTNLDEDSWFKIDSFNTSPYCIDLLKNEYSTVDFDLLTKGQFTLIDYIFVQQGDYICFQNITKSKLISRKAIIHIGDNYQLDNNSISITINASPDAIYDKNRNVLYFKKLSSITSIFKGIEQLYREATDSEVQSFLNNKFIHLSNGFDANSVKTPNRHRIAIAVDALGRLKKDEKKQVLSYINDYCPELKYQKGTFEIGSEEELKQLLYGIEQRYYTTIVGGEKRLANSIIKLN